MIYTSSYKDWKSDKYKTYSISGDRGKNTEPEYQGEYYQALAPKKDFWKKWHKKIGKISEEENNWYYIQEFWKEVLSKLDPSQVYKELDDSVLLCYESSELFCHRHIVAAWFEILLDVKVPEIVAKGNEFEERERPAYIKEYLEAAMRQNRDMRGFTSLRALYLFEQSEELEEKADKYEQETGLHYNDFRQKAIFLRSSSESVEKMYRDHERNKILQKQYN